jgi:flagellar basal-body rod protein FlgB
LRKTSVFIDQLTNAGAIPALEASVQFAARRQSLIAHNIANFSTPNYEPSDVSVTNFHSQLGDAIDRRREAFGGHRGDLHLRDTREVSQGQDGRLRLSPGASGRNVLFHDRNSRDLERTMQDLVENVASFRVATDLLKSRIDLLRTAISERV